MVQGLYISVAYLLVRRDSLRVTFFKFIFKCIRVCGDDISLVFSINCVETYQPMHMLLSLFTIFRNPSYVTTHTHTISSAVLPSKQLLLRVRLRANNLML